MRRFLFPLAALLTLGSLSCGGSKDNTTPTPTAPTPKVLTTIRVTLVDSVLVVGKTTQATAATLDQFGAAMSGKIVTWRSTDSTIASVQQTGIVLALKDGAVSIQATADTKQGSANLRALFVPVVTTIKVVIADTLLYGQTAQATVVVTDQLGQPIPLPTVRWSSSDSTTVSVNAGGTVRSLYVGTVSISATVGAVTASKTLVAYSRWAATEHVLDFEKLRKGCNYEMRWALGDLDADGRDDVVLGGWINCESYANPLAPLKVLLWDATEHLVDRTKQLFGSEVFAGVNVPVVRDVNGDGKPDIFLAGFADSYTYPVSSQLFLNKGASFSPVDISSPKIWGHGSAVADVNGDGCADLLQGGGSGGTDVETYFWLGNCLGQFQGVVVPRYDWRGQRKLDVTLSNGAPATVYSPSGMSVCPADFNGDGKLEVLYTDALMFTKNGGVNPAQDNVIVEFDWTQPNPVGVHLLPEPLKDRGNKGTRVSHDQRCYVGDLNRDGKPDVIVTSTPWDTWAGSSIQVYLNRGGWQFEDITDRAFAGGRSTDSGSGFSNMLRDLNGDGILDFFFPAESWQNKLDSQLWRGNGDGTFSPVVIDWNTMYQSAAEALRRRLGSSAKNYQIQNIAEPVLLPRRDGALDFLVGIGYTDEQFQPSVFWFLARTGFRF